MAVGGSGAVVDGLAEQADSFLSIVQQGKTFSGRERHCCFLNTTQGHFANISGPSGLDSADDGRAAAQVDWDLDGDLDLWVSNRNAPQVRFFLNNQKNNHHYLAVQLTGTSCNRDAVGARVSLFLKDQPTPILRTLRAGEGFLTQASKWIHFGLGTNDRVEKLVVRWPGGANEAIRDLTVDMRYKIVQGRGASPPQPKRDLQLESIAWKEPQTDNAVELFLSDRLPVPQLAYATFDGHERHVFERTSHRLPAPVLLNLWASWCEPCMSELRNFGEHRDEIRKRGVRVIALCVDGLTDESAATSQAAELVEKLQFPFSAGVASAALVEKLQVLNNLVFDVHEPLPIPTSVLIDQEGRLAAIYKGPLTADRLFADLGNVSLDFADRRRASLPFDGRWFGPPQRVHPIVPARRLARKGFIDDAVAVMAREEKVVIAHREAPMLLLDIAKGYEARELRKAAIEYYERSIEQARIQGYDDLVREVTAHLQSYKTPK